MFADDRAAPVGQAEVGLGGVRAGVDDLGCGLSGDGPMDLVLNGLEEQETEGLRGVIVDAGGVEVGDFLIEPGFGCADVLDAAGEFFEVVEGLVGIFQAFVIKGEAFDDVFPQTLGGSDAEAGGDGAFDAVADGDDGVEIVYIGAALDGAYAFLANRQGFLVSSRELQFALSVDVLKVEADILLGGLEEFRHELLGEPDGFAFQAYFEFEFSVWGLVDEELAAGRG